jgi:hypothetical protein
VKTSTSPENLEVREELVQAFVPAYFGDIDLGHKSRNRCFTRVAQQISRHPGGTLPDKLSDPADYMAMDRLVNRPETTHASVLTPHCQRTLDKMRAAAETVLIVQDTTVLDRSASLAEVRLVRLSLDGGGISQSAKDGLPDRVASISQ